MLYQPDTFAFIHVPRTAGMSIRETILADARHFDGINCNSFAGKTWRPHTRRHTTYRELQGVIPEIDRIYTFLVIRNPFDWLESTYSQLSHWRDCAFENRPNINYQSEIYRSVEETLQGGFAEFVKRHKHIMNDGGMTRHWGANRNGRIAVSGVIRLEELSNRWSEIYYSLGPIDVYSYEVPEKPPELRRSNAVPRLSVEWSKDLIGIVRNGFRYDFENYYPEAVNP